MEIFLLSDEIYNALLIESAHIYGYDFYLNVNFGFWFSHSGFIEYRSAFLTVKKRFPLTIKRQVVSALHNINLKQ